jgi:hypothetical protein
MTGSERIPRTVLRSIFDIFGAGLASVFTLTKGRLPELIQKNAQMPGGELLVYFPLF